MEPAPAPRGDAWHDLPWRDPELIFTPLAHTPYALFLDGAAEPEHPVSYIAAGPDAVIIGQPDGRICISGTHAAETPAAPDLFTFLQTAAAPTLQGPGFCSGWAGFLGHNAGDYLEHRALLTPAPAHPHALPGAVLAHYPSVLRFEHAMRRCSAFGPHAAAWHAQGAGPTFLPRPLPRFGSVQGNFPPGEYARRVQRVRDYIFAGDIYQANLTQTWRLPVARAGSGWALYQHLRARQQGARHAGYFHTPTADILSFSPELFLEVRGPQVTTRPIKGTRPRGQNAAEDAARRAALLTSAKDHAENLMIVDLLRNDLSRICRAGSVRVPQLMALESTNAVHHLVSTVTGELPPDSGIAALLRATFPGGSITGAPKIRARQIIQELEPTPRGAYCGSLGFMGAGGDAMFNILIRTLTLFDQDIWLQAGAGIVAESDPASEDAECLAKIAPLLSAVQELEA